MLEALARSAGVDDQLDPALVERIFANLEPRIDMMRGGGFFGPAHDAGGKTDRQSQLLVMVARNPHCRAKRGRQLAPSDATGDVAERGMR